MPTSINFKRIFLVLVVDLKTAISNSIFLLSYQYPPVINLEILYDCKLQGSTFQSVIGTASIGLVTVWRL